MATPVARSHAVTTSGYHKIIDSDVECTHVMLTTKTSYNTVRTNTALKTFCVASFVVV